MPELKPTSYPDWATNDVTLPVAGTNNKIEPRTIMQTQGADKGNFFGAEEANWILNSNGLWTRYLDQEAQHLKDTNLREYSTVADMVADELLEVGDYVRTLGYHSFGDTGGSIYKVVTSGTADGMTVIDLTNGLVAEFVYVSNVLSPMQFGAVGDGSADDSVPMQKLADLLEDNPSETVLQGGITIDLQGRKFAVNVVPQNVLTIQNGTLRAINNSSNIVEFVQGDVKLKTDGWDSLKLYNVIFDGGLVNSGTVTMDDQAGGITIEDTNNGIYISVASTSAAKSYKVDVLGCTFKDVWNSNIFIANSVSNVPWVTTIDKCYLNKTGNVDNLKIHNVFIGNSESSVNITDCKLLDINSAVFYDNACDVNIQASTIRVADNPANAAFLGDTSLNIGGGSRILLEGATHNITYYNYNLTIESSVVEGTELYLYSNHLSNSYANFKASNSNFSTLYIKRLGDAGDRVEVNIRTSNCEFDVLNIEPADSNNEPPAAPEYDVIRLAGTTVTDEFNILCRTNSQRSKVIITGSDLTTSGNPMITVPGAAPEAITLSGNSLTGNTSIISTPRNSVDTGDFYAVLENITEGVTNLVFSTGDASTVTAKYQA